MHINLARCHSVAQPTMDVRNRNDRDTSSPAYRPLILLINIIYILYNIHISLPLLALLLFSSFLNDTFSFCKPVKAPCICCQGNVKKNSVKNTVCLLPGSARFIPYLLASQSFLQATASNQRDALGMNMCSHLSKFACRPYEHMFIILNLIYRWNEQMFTCEVIVLIDL